MVGPPRLQGHHCSRISPTLRSRAPSSKKSSRDGAQLSMHRCFVCLTPFGSSWSALRYSFKNPSFTKFASWWPRAIHRSISCPNPLWNSHQTSFRDPRFLSVFWRNFSFSMTPGMPNNSLYDTWNLGQNEKSLLAFALGTFLLVAYGTYLESILFLPRSR